MKIYNPFDVPIHDLEVADNSVRYRSIMTDDSLTLYFSLVDSIEIPQFSYTIFEGERYTLWRPSEFKKHSSRNHEYTLTLHGWREYLKFVKFRDMGERPHRLRFPLTAKPITFLQNLVNCLNQHDPVGGWSVGDCIDTPERTISFNHEFCLDVLNRLASEFETEFEFEDKKIHLRRVERFKENPLALSYGKGNGFRPGVGRYNEGDKQPVGRLFVQGGERNIDFSVYGSRSLLLPKSQTLVIDGKTFRTDAHGMCITRDGNDNRAEDSLDASQIYPKRVGTVSDVIVVNAEKHFFDIIDNTIPEELNFRNYRIAGEKAIIKFESGALAGREFDIEQTADVLTGYIHAERRFRIVPAEIDGFTMPGGVFVPRVDDRYAIFNIAMPQAYISDDATQTGASWDMFREAARYFVENENERFRFTGELDGVWSKSRWLQIGGQIVPGGHVLFSDEQFQQDGVVIRIVGIKDYVNMPHKPEITLSNAPISSSFSVDMGRIEANEVVIEENKRELIRFSQRQWRETRETFAMLQGALLNFSGSINPLTVQTMQMIAGDESLQFRFVNNKTNPQPVRHTVAFNPTNGRLTADGGILQHLTLGITEIRANRPANDYVFWTMSAYTSPPLEADKPYFLYARCSRTAAVGSFLLSETPIAMKEQADWFHLLVGILNSENNGDRSFAQLYGFTEILPGRITTNRIVSDDGRTFFDLLNGVIGGRIVFQSGTDTYTYLDRWADSTNNSVREAQDNANDARDRVENLQIGGVNLLPNSGRWGNEWNGVFWINQSGGLAIDPNTTFLGSNTIRTSFTTAGAGIAGSWLRLENGVEYCYSAMMMSSINLDGHPNVPMHFHAGLNNTNQGKIQVLRHDTTLIANQWKRVFIVFRLTQDANSFRPFIWSHIGNAVINIAHIQLERGNRPTDWSPTTEEQRGEDGRGILSTAITYQASMSGTAAPTGTWTAAIPSVSASQFLWTRTVITYTDNTTTTSFSVGKMGDAGAAGATLTNGLMLNRDPEFRDGLNGYGVYNNSGGTAVRITRVARPADAPTTSSHIMRYSFVGGATSPNFGGFSRFAMSRANAVFIHRIIAKIPVGYSIMNNQNAVGNNPRHEWLTPRAGTGRYEEYLYRLTSGATGTFSDFGYISFELRTAANASIPFDVDVAYAAIFDMTQNDATADEAAAAAAQARAITDGFTAIDGGLVTANMMSLREISRTETAGINGLQGADGRNPAFWAGGTYAQALNRANNPNATTNAAAAVITHDGRAIFNNAIISGEIRASGGRVGDFNIVGGVLGTDFIQGTTRGLSLSRHGIAFNALIGGAMTSMDIALNRILVTGTSTGSLPNRMAGLDSAGVLVRRPSNNSLQYAIGGQAGMFLGAFTVLAGGGVQNVKAHGIGFNATRTAVGRYRVVHTIGITTYTVVAMPVNGQRIVTLTHRDALQMLFECVTTGNNFADQTFDVIVWGF